MDNNNNQPPKRGRGRPPKQKQSVSFVSDGGADGKAGMSPEIITSSIRNSLNLPNEGLMKSVKPTTVKKEHKGQFEKSKIVYSSREDTSATNNVDIKGWSRISDAELKSIVQVDPYLSAIISTRAAQGAIIGRPSESKFDKGTRVVELAPIKYEEFESKDAFKKEQQSRAIKIKAIQHWFNNCGTTNRSVLMDIYSGEDKTWMFCSLAEFISAQIRNLLTFGRMATQLLRDVDGNIVAFRPAPVETIYPVIYGKDVSIGVGSNTSEQSIKDLEEYEAIDEEERPRVFVQRVDGQDVNFFTEDQLRVHFYQKQALFGLDGFPLAPIEQASYMVYTHFKTLEYLRNYFVKGIGAKSMLVIRTTDPSTSLSREDLDSIRASYHNFVSRNDNSATTPVLAGPIDVNVVPLASNPKDMEFLNVEEHIIRALCSAMQISPQEMGYGHLSQGNGGLTQSNKQEEIVRGEERGLRMVLDTIFDCLNEILGEHFPEAEREFRLSYTGVGEDTRDGVLGRSTAQLQTTATLSSLYADSEKNEVVAFGGDVPLASAFHANVARYMKYGEMREYFFGETDAAKNPVYDFIIDPTLNQSYQLLKTTPIDMQQEKSAIGMAQEKLQLQSAEEQAQQMQQQMQQQAKGGGQPQGGGDGGGGGQEEPKEDDKAEKSEELAKEGPEKSVSIADALDGKEKERAESMSSKSILEAMQEAEALEKSLGIYFKTWLSVHK